MKRLLFCLAVLLVHNVHAENPAQPVLRVNRMKATNNSGGKIEIDSSMFFKNNADRDDFVANLNLGTPATFPWASVTGKPATLDGYGITDYAIKKLAGLTGITGGANNLDGVSIAPLAVGTVVCQSFMVVLLVTGIYIVGRSLLKAHDGRIADLKERLDDHRARIAQTKRSCRSARTTAANYDSTSPATRKSHPLSVVA